MRNYYVILMVLVNMLFINVSMAEERPLTVTVDRPWGLLLGDEINVKVDLEAKTTLMAAKVASVVEHI